jgi:hypothetical protein
MDQLKALVASNIRDNKMVRRLEKNIEVTWKAMQSVLRDTERTDVLDFFQ